MRKRSHFSGTEVKSPYLQSTSAKKPFSNVKMPKYIGNHKVDDSLSGSKSRSRSRGQKKQCFSNQDKVQVCRDERGIKRKIEYLNDSTDSNKDLNDDLIYSAPNPVKAETPNFDEENKKSN